MINIFVLNINILQGYLKKYGKAKKCARIIKSSLRMITYFEPRKPVKGTYVIKYPTERL